MNGEVNKNRIVIFAIGILVAVLAFLYFLGSSTQSVFTSQDIKKDEIKDLSLLIVGDIMLDRNVRNKINEIGFEEFFKGVSDLISNADLAIGNLEGPFTMYPSLTASLKNKALQFTFDPTLANKLSSLGFDILGLANNHTLNFGLEGLEMTKEYIRNAGMFYYGDPNNSKEISIITEKNGIVIGIIGFHEFSYINSEKIISEIDSIKDKVDVLIVTPHWGIEYKKAPTEKMKKWAYEYIDHGAHIVIGTHPHIVGDTEEYKGRMIFYSLGNFVFDQYFSEDTMNGLAIKLDIEKIYGSTEIKHSTIPIRIDKKGPYILSN
ncbi:MAG TPA: CapA family protein [Candidatus Paceibacterota bacterium]